MKKIKTEYYNRLPHIAPVGASFFVTFRLSDSLPQHVIKALKKEMHIAVNRVKLGQPKDRNDHIIEIKKIYFTNFEHPLDDKIYGECYLSMPDIAQIIKNKLHSLDGVQYDLIAYCIMPNHVHMLVDFSIQIVDANGFYHLDIPENYTQLSSVMKMIKGGSAYESNKVLERNGSFWYKDSYDRYIRDEKDYWNVINYIIHNPVKANLVEKWNEYEGTFVKKEVLMKL